MEDKRIDLDAANIEDLHELLAKDVAEAAQNAKDQRAKDATRHIAEAVERKNVIMYVIIAVGVIFLLIFLIKMVLGTRSTVPEPGQTGPKFSQPAPAPTPRQVAPAYGTRPVQPVTRPPAHVVRPAPRTVDPSGGSSADDNANPDGM